MNRRTFEEMVSYFNQTVADMDIDRKYKMELLGMITAILQRHDEDMKHAPTIEPKNGKWIPCSERLPDEDLWTGTGKQFSNSVLMTVYDKNDEDTIVDYGHTTDGEWYSETADEYVESIADWKVIAWMPLPLPYKGEQE